ncbi:MAG: hypothetical protein AMXMBFR84_09040 [Candidatus Hydrogenedentota bacterium]
MRAMWTGFFLLAIPAFATGVPADNYPSLQEAIDANPGKMVELGPNDYVIGAALRITSSGGGLCGYGRIVMTNPEESIIHVRQTRDVRIEDIALTRSEGAMDALRHGIHVEKCANVQIDGVQVIDNRSQAGTIFFEECTDSRVVNSTVLNYKRICVDDRTASPLYGYAFKVIDGTGIMVVRSQGMQVVNNRVLERNIYPTEETKKTFQLGNFTEGANPTQKGQLAPPGEYANNWHQGSAITVSAPLETRHVLISGNYIENAAQGIDMHGDHMTCSNNIIDHAFIGIKCMHGSKNVIITGNNVSHMDLWGLIMMPGTLSHPAQPASGDQPAKPANFTSGNIISNNIFADFGFGYEYFNWKGSKGGVISLESGQLAENPVMFDVLIQGNVVYDTGRDEVLENGVPVKADPRYEYAVFMSPEPRPKGLVFRDNVFHPGRGGISNLPLE